MDFSPSKRAVALRHQIDHFIARYVLPYNAVWHQSVHAGVYPPPFLADLKALAQEEGLWNLFLPGLRDDEPGTRLSNLDYAPLAEAMGRLPWAAEVFNCSAPDTGNMELLHRFASDAQRTRWLQPLLAGHIRSAFAMSEPDVASSDPTNLQTTVRRDGDSLVLVLMDTPGMRVLRNIPVVHHHAPEGHCEILFTQVRVPADHLLGTWGEGFAMAQARLGPGRVHHCMRSIGQCELALALATERTLERRAFGRHLADYANAQDWIAESRIEIDQARLLVLHAAWALDEGALTPTALRAQVAAIKVVAARLQTRVVDRAMQVFGAALLALAVLHLSLVVRLGGGAFSRAWRATGGVLHAVAIGLYVLTMLGAALAWRLRFGASRARRDSE